MKLRKKLTAGLLAAIMAVSVFPSGISAEQSGAWTDEDTFNSMLYSTVYTSNKMYSDHAESTYSYPVVHIDERETTLGVLTGNNSIQITAGQLKSNAYNDKVSLGFQFTFENHRILPTASYLYGNISVSSGDGSFTSTTSNYGYYDSPTRSMYGFAITCKASDLQSGIVIRLAEEKEDDQFYNPLNTVIRSGNPLYLRCVEVRNIYNYEKATTLEGISGDLDALGSITVPASALASYPVEDESRPGALLSFDYDLKTDAPSLIGLDYQVKGQYYSYGQIGTLVGNIDQNLISLLNANYSYPKQNGITVKYSTSDGYGAILKSVSVYLPTGVTYPDEPATDTGYHSVGESIKNVPVGTAVTQKTNVVNGKFSERFVKKVAATDVVGKTKATFTLSNGTVAKTVSTTQYYTSLTVDGEKVSSGEGYVFLVYTLSGIPEGVNITATGVTLE
ncbi:MAG: hypothetical protein NC084_04240 [Bacteroides sp.]|nr:hypothetical protein [Eubacterium sp.]MCM1417927.1 hypothetical protein [Roseburia sp.]MCM1461910.1 hypothetical protein [Bacteroides sp.]